MITNLLVINDLGTFESIANHAAQRKEHFLTIYDGDYDKFIDTLIRFSERFNINRGQEDFNQNQIEFSLQTMLMFKNILYDYLKHKAASIGKEELEFITNVLEHSDEWINEEMNTEHYFIRSVLCHENKGTCWSSYYE